MAGLQHISITARYEPRVSHGTSLAWIAPELRHAGLALIDDHLDDPMPSRTWAGSVDERTFERFAKSWRLPREDQLGSTSQDDGEHVVPYARTYDGMNWEVGGESPIISVSVYVGPDARHGVSTETRVSAPRRGSDRRTDSSEPDQAIHVIHVSHDAGPHADSRQSRARWCSSWTRRSRCDRD